MAEDAERGVVNSRSQVFSGAQGMDVHDGLYVMDGSIVPRSLGVNPLLTISALAERSCELTARDHNWPLDTSGPSAFAQEQPEPKTGVQFTETMRGYFSTEVTGEDDYEEAAQRGEQDNSPFEFTLSIVSEDLDRFIDEPEHEAGMLGTALSPVLSASPMVATDGRFNLFVDDSSQPRVKRMKYGMKLTTTEGRAFWFEGFKLVRDDSGFDVVSDTTTLFITVHDGESIESPVMGRGILKIEMTDTARQLTTMEATNAPNRKEAAKALARFGEYFAGSLWKVYGP